MKIDRKFFKEHHNAESLPAWICPSCNYGILTASKDSIQINESIESKNEHNDDDHEPFWIRGYFTGKLTCSNTKCKEIHFFSGSASVDFTDYEIDKYGDPNETYGWFINPKYFSQPLKLFPIQEYYPKEISDLLKESFGLIWTDPAACANKVRSLVEKILDNRKIKKYNLSTKKKRIPIYLHNRINDFRKKNSEAGDLFEAIKWLGNKGSHADDEKLKREDLLTAFEMLERALDIIYNSHPKDLRKLAGKIIKRKGPVKLPKKRSR